MTGLARRTGWSVRVSRTLIEVVVLGAGWLLGGSVGVGTVVYALAIGPRVQLLLPYFMVPRYFEPVGELPKTGTGRVKKVDVPVLEAIGEYFGETLAYFSGKAPPAEEAAKLRDSRQRQRQGRFLIDGAREILRAIERGIEVVEAFLCEPLVRDESAVG